MKQSSSQKARAPLASSTESRVLISIALIAATFFVFWPALSFEFVSFDDPAFVSENAQVLRGLTWDGALWAFRFDHGDYWHPLTWLSLMLDVSLFGRAPAGFHFTNILLHAANAVLVFLLLQRWTGSFWRSAIVAALFALHPLRIQSVVWITERKDVLSTLFGLLAIWAYSRSVKSEVRGAKGGSGKSDLRPPTSGLRFPSSPHYWLAFALFACGLMAKAMLVTLPFVLLLLDYWPLKRVSFGFGISDSTTSHAKAETRKSPAESLNLVFEKLPFFILSALSCAVTWWGQNRLNEGGPVPEVSWLVRAQHVFATYANYLYKTFWPSELSVYYPHPRGWPWWEILLAAALVLGVCAAAVWWARRRPYLFTGWFWFFGVLVPVLPLTRDWLEFSPDRFVYVPAMGLFIALVWGAAELFARWRLPRAAIGTIALAVIILLSLQTRGESRYWKDSETLYRRAIAVTKNNALAFYNLGCELEKQKRFAPALECFYEALAIRPDYPEAHINIGSALLRENRLDEAIQHYRKAIAGNPKLLLARDNLGIALTSRGQIDEAIEQFSEALRLKPDSAKIHNDLGNALFQAERFDEAMKHYRESLRLNPKQPETLSNLGVMFALRGKIDEAIESFNQALALAPNNVGTHVNLGTALEDKGRLAEAAAHYGQVVSLTPNSPAAHFDLGRVLVKLNRQGDAILHLKRALELKSDYAEPRQLLRDLGAMSE